MGSRVIKLNWRKNNISREFYNSIVTNMRLCQLSGCAPFKFSEKGIEKSFLAYFYLMILVIGYVGLLVEFFLNRFRREGITYHGPIYASSLLSVLTIWIDGVFRVNGWSTILKKIITIDQGLHKFNIWVDYEKCLKKSRWMLIVQLIQIFVPIMMRYYSTDPMHVRTLFTFSFVPNCMIILLSYALSQVVSLIKERLHILNDLLKTLTTRNNIEEISVVNGKDKRKPLHVLCHVCTWHHNINKVIRMINETFGFRMVGLFGYTFVLLVINIHLICKQFNEKIIWPKFLYALTSASNFAYCVYLTCNACEQTIKEAAKSGFLIHQIETNDCDMIDEIEMFSLQIANEDIEFSAAGFFPVNSSLMFSIIGGVTTYIIILIQLNSTGTSSKANSTTTIIDDISTTYKTTLS